MLGGLAFRVAAITSGRYSCARIAPVVLLRNAPLSVGRKSSRSKRPRPPAPKEASKEDFDPWMEVRDEATGQTYWWNPDTDETTALGEPKPGSSVAPSPSSAPPPTQQQQGGMMSGLGGVMAEGFAFGVGSSVAR